MATMIPNDIESFTTDGEERFYRFLEQVAKPDSDFISWYTPDIDGNEPDFILFNREVGLIVFEVKDWALRQIRGGDRHSFTLEIDGKTTKRENPLHQAKGYTHNIIDKIIHDGRLLSTDPSYHGKSKIPISYGVIFPNINKHEYLQAGLDKVISQEKIFFWDDLNSQSDICCDASGRCFREVVSQKFKPRFSFKLTGSELGHLRQLLFPEIRIELPERDKNAARHREGIRMLDHHQETLARKYDGGHRIIIGPSGSGKSVILAHKAVFLFRYIPYIERTGPIPELLSSL